MLRADQNTSSARNMEKNIGTIDIPEVWDLGRLIVLSNKHRECKAQFLSF